MYRVFWSQKPKKKKRENGNQKRSCTELFNVSGLIKEPT